MESRGDDQIASMVFWNGWDGHEPEMAPQFFALAREARTTLDIGAHVGYFALLAALANPDGHVYAFEPLARIHQRLERNRVLNDLKNLTCLPLAVGSERGQAQFFHADYGIPSSSSLSQEFMKTVIPPSHLVASEVQVTTVDDFVEEQNLDHIDLVKMDTEATEDAVFRGMARTLKRFRPVIFCEVLNEHTASAIEAILVPLDYQFFLMTGTGQLKCEHLSPRPPWRNFCFSPGSP